MVYVPSGFTTRTNPMIQTELTIALLSYLWKDKDIWVGGTLEPVQVILLHTSNALSQTCALNVHPSNAQADSHTQSVQMIVKECCMCEVKWVGTRCQFQKTSHSPTSQDMIKVSVLSSLPIIVSPKQGSTIEVKPLTKAWIISSPAHVPPV